MINRLFSIFATILFFHNMVHAAEVENSAVDVCDCPGIENFADDIHGVLTNLYLSNQTVGTQEAFAQIDNLKLLLTVQRDANGALKCEESTMAFLNEDSNTKVSLLRSGLTELGVVSNQLNLKPTRPDLIHLASGGKREMFFLGRIDGKEVYFHLVIDQNGDAKINYLPILKESKPQFESLAQVTLKDDDAASIARNGIDDTQEVERLKWQIVDTENNQPVVAVDTTESSATTKLYLRNEDNSSVFTISGNVKNINTEETTAGPVGIQYQNKGESTEVRIGTSIDPSVEEPTPRFNGGVTQVIAPKIKASISGETTGPEDVKSKGALNLGDENLGLTLSANTENELITRREARVKAKHDILSGELGIVSTERGETVSGKGGVDVTDATSLTSNFVIDPGFEQFGVGAEYTGKTDDDGYKVGCEANVRILNDEQYKITPKVHYQSHSGQQKHRVSCETGPILDQDGLVGVQFKTQYDYKVADTTSVGVYVQGISYQDGRSVNRDLAVGLQGTIKFGGPRPSPTVKKLKVHTLVYSKIEHKFGKDSLIGYYKTTGYTCDTKRKKVKARNESSLNRRHWFKVAVDPGTPLAPVVYSPADQRPDTFCVFSK